MVNLKVIGKIRIVYADEGKILTNGSLYGKEIFLTPDDSPENYYEIDEQEFLQKEQTALEAAQEALN